MGLARLAGGADKIAQHSDVGTVGTDAAGIHGETEALGEIKINAGIVEFRQTETLGGQHAVQTRGIDGPGRAVTLPGAARQFVKLLPIAFVPRRHCSLCYILFLRLDARGGQKVRRVFVSHRSSHPASSRLPIPP